VYRVLKNMKLQDSVPTKLPYLSPAQVDAVLSKTGVDKKKFQMALRQLRSCIDGKMHLSDGPRVAANATRAALEALAGAPLAPAQLAQLERDARDTEAKLEAKAVAEAMAMDAADMDEDDAREPTASGEDNEDEEDEEKDDGTGPFFADLIKPAVLQSQISKLKRFEQHGSLEHFFSLATGSYYSGEDAEEEDDDDEPYFESGSIVKCPCESCERPHAALPAPRARRRRRRAPSADSRAPSADRDPVRARVPTRRVRPEHHAVLDALPAHGLRPRADPAGRSQQRARQRLAVAVHAGQADPLQQLRARVSMPVVLGRRAAAHGLHGVLAAAGARRDLVHPLPEMQLPAPGRPRCSFRRRADHRRAGQPEHHRQGADRQRLLPPLRPGGAGHPGAGPDFVDRGPAAAADAAAAVFPAAGIRGRGHRSS
jgi:hypothetical protein